MDKIINGVQKGREKALSKLKITFATALTYDKLDKKIKIFVTIKDNYLKGILSHDEHFFLKERIMGASILV